MAGGLVVEEGGADACCGCGPAQIRDMRSCACHIGCEIVPPALCKRLVPRVGGGRTIVNRFLRAGRKSVTDTVMSRYLCASIVYVAYTVSAGGRARRAAAAAAAAAALSIRRRARHSSPPTGAGPLH
jgi:hypothetical protein